VSGRLIRRRGLRFGWPGPPGQQLLRDEENFDERYPTPDDEGNHGHTAGASDAPFGILRFKANAQAWRQRLHRELLLAPLTGPDRERIMRWLNNLRGREVWQAARLEHTIATKRLLLEALNGGKSARPSGSRPAAEEATLVDDGEDN
jgi:hypothetical protein